MSIFGTEPTVAQLSAVDLRSDAIHLLYSKRGQLATYFSQTAYA
jgi:hypothetical protein